MSSLLLFATFLAIFIGRTFSQAVTLWEFGAKRLASGQTTLPLQPIGIASDGLSTTYLYQVVSAGLYVTVNYIPEIGVLAVVESRTIVASASGWIERFAPTHAIECNFFPSQSASGVCFDETQTNQGTPTPVVLAVSTPLVAPSSSTPAAFITTTTTSSMQTLQTLQTSDPTTSPTAIISMTTPTPSHNVPVGAIIGVTIAGALIVCALVFLVLWLLRRQHRLERRLTISADLLQEMATVEAYQHLSSDSQVIYNTPTYPPPYSSNGGNSVPNQPSQRAVTRESLWQP
ncbi:hypothetical protein C8R42DRAFT_679922 [Lentinula raphanica]|nr:hypothetical protein C8R42DRAFT_679922 [Lentinula raphanica]